MINYKWLTIPYASTHPFYLHQLLSFTSKQLQKFVKNYMLLDFSTADTNYLVQQPTRSIHYFIPELPQRSRELSWQRCSSSSLFSPRRKYKKGKLVLYWWGLLTWAFPTGLYFSFSLQRINSFLPFTSPLFMSL